MQPLPMSDSEFMPGSGLRGPHKPLGKKDQQRYAYDDSALYEAGMASLD